MHYKLQFREYYQLTKPGIVYGNAMAAAAGFLLASRGHIAFWRLLATLIGMSLVIACGCVLNNYIDRGLDKKMARTKKRALVSGIISVRGAIVFAVIMGLLGLITLILFTNFLVVGIGTIGLFFYVVVYGVSKRRSVHGTLVGTISGATPPVAGYAAASGHLDGGALIIFLIMVCWQMPHFYAIAMYRYKDYKAAGLPVLPVVKGMRRTKLEILFYTFGFIVSVILLSVLGYTGLTFLVIMGGLGLYWMWRGLQGFNALDDNKWGRQMFGFSLIVLLSLSAMLAIGPVLP